MALTRYELDPTGTNPNNLVVDEQHNIDIGKFNIVVPKAGLYFTISMVVTDVATNRILERGIDYQCNQLAQAPTMQYGYEIMTNLIFLDKTFSGTVSLRYHCLGGEYQDVVPVLQEIVDLIMEDNRPVDWMNILNKPTEYPPSTHRHYAEDMVGMEFLVYAIDRLKEAVMIGSMPTQQALVDYVYGMATALASYRNIFYPDGNGGYLISPKNIPIATETINGSVELATIQEVITGTVTDKVLTPSTITALLESLGLIGSDAKFVTDLNNAIGAGNYAFNIDALNRPDINCQYGTLTVNVRGNSEVTQVAIDVVTGKVWTRTRYNGTFTNWLQTAQIDSTNTITANTTGNAATATRLQTGRKINGVLFDGTSDITINSAYDIQNFTNGQPLLKEVLIRMVAVRPFVCNDQFLGSVAICTTPSTNVFQIELIKNGIRIGLITFNPNIKTAVWSSTEVPSFATGDTLSARCIPDVQDPTLADISINILGFMV